MAKKLPTKTGKAWKPGDPLKFDSATRKNVPDGAAIDLPLGQRTKPVIAAVQPRMAKLRILTITVLAVGLWFLSVALTASLLEGM